MMEVTTATIAYLHLDPSGDPLTTTQVKSSLFGSKQRHQDINRSPRALTHRACHAWDECAVHVQYDQHNLPFRYQVDFRTFEVRISAFYGTRYFDSTGLHSQLSEFA
jgi:hypothetical protein